MQQPVLLSTTGVFQCPDHDQATSLLNDLRDAAGQPPLEWSSTLEAQLLQAVQRSPSNTCPDSPQLQLPSSSGIYWWGNYSTAPDGARMTRCGGSLVAYWQVRRAISFFGCLFGVFWYLFFSTQHTRLLLPAWHVAPRASMYLTHAHIHSWSRKPPLRHRPLPEGCLEEYCGRHRLPW